MTTGGQQQLKTLTNAITKVSPTCRLGPAVLASNATRTDPAWRYGGQRYECQ